MRVLTHGMTYTTYYSIEKTDTYTYPTLLGIEEI